VIAVGGTALAFVDPSDAGSQPTATAAGPHVTATLSPAQRRVLVALCRPYRDGTFATPATNRRIADEPVVSVDAVKTTLRALFSVFGLDATAAEPQARDPGRPAQRRGGAARPLSRHFH
jgi:hypothetical protein